MIPELQELVEKFEELERLSQGVRGIVGALSERVLASEETSRLLRIRLDVVTGGIEQEGWEGTTDVRIDK